MQTKKATNEKHHYKPEVIEQKWQEKWERTKIYEPNLADPNKPFFNLFMFPYPSAEGMHVGNMFMQTGSDIYARFHRMNGFDTFQPTGLDGFGIHAENYALKIGVHPMQHAQVTENNFYRQMKSTGSSFAWSHSLETYDIDYYRWTQWVFIELFKAGLAYRAEAEVNWCPSCKTVLADEQVIDGRCERCNSVVEKKMLAQWFFRITAYAEELLAGLSQIDWTEKVKIAQRNWIGKSEGARITFPLKNPKGKITELEVFTTRPDTLYGVTFVVVSPEHPLALELASADPKVQVYTKETQQKTTEERREAKEKTGVFGKAYVTNPINNKQLPIWIADYVLMGYGTGAIMAVPAHDERDFAFAKKYGLPVAQVIQSPQGRDVLEEAYTGSGVLINSGEWTGIKVPQEISKILTSLSEKGIGEKKTTYHLRDWLISRQRYWGPPIPMIFCETCAKKGASWFSINQKENEKGIHHSEFIVQNAAGWYPEEHLPVELPYIDDYKPLGTGKSPLGNHPEFYETICPHCGGKATRETDVSDTFLDSSWYFLRYLATDLSSLPFPMTKEASSQLGSGDKAEQEEAEKRTGWIPVTQYIGGAEHSVLHLLYTRFLYKVFVDKGYIEKGKGDEPFPKFYAHGLIVKDGAKMSKSKGNVVIPDQYIKKFGADTLRTYLMFLGPFSEGGDFRDTGIEGMYRFLKRVWVMGTGENISSRPLPSSANALLHKTIKGVTSDIKAFRYNTAIAKLMTLYNALSSEKEVNKDAFLIFLQLLAPFAPHMTEELWEYLGRDYSIHLSSWPTYNEEYLVEDKVTIVVQVNGKLRDDLTVTKDSINDQKKVENLANQSAKLQKYLEGQHIKKVIYIPGKILNYVSASTQERK